MEEMKPPEKTFKEDIPLTSGSSLTRRNLLKAAIAGALGAPLLAQAAEGQERTAQRMEIIDERGDPKIPMRIKATPIGEGTEATGTDTEPPLLSPGTYHLYAGPATPELERQNLWRCRYEIVDAQGKNVESFDMTYTAVHNLHLESGQRVRVTMLPTFDIKTSATQWQAPQRNPAKMENAKPKPLEIVRTGDPRDHHFNVLVSAIDAKTENETRMEEWDTQALPPRTYHAVTRHTHTGFPQPIQYSVIDAEGNAAFESPVLMGQFGPMMNANVGDGERLRIKVLPIVRPYNSSFEKGKDGTSRGIMFPRPYPKELADAGDFHGDEQFNAAPLAIAFWGERECEAYPDIAEKIRETGDASVRPACKDPVLVLGCRAVARRLATFMAEKRKQLGTNQDFRGKDHVSFLIQRLPDGSMSKDLAEASEEQLAEIMGRRLLHMLWHNAHRINEGGGYADHSFTQDLQEAKAMVQTWPETSVKSTQLLLEDIPRLEKLIEDQGPDVKTLDLRNPLSHQRGEMQPAKTLLRITPVRILQAIIREEQNLANYPATKLKRVEQMLGKTIEQRKAELKKLREEMLQKNNE